jgi:hypothetical protein
MEDAVNDEQNRKIIPLTPQRSALDRYRRTDASVLTSPLRPPSYSVVIRRPKKTEFIRTQLSPGCLGPFPIVIDNERFFAVDRSMWQLLADHLVDMALIPSTTDMGRIFLWPVRLPDAQGRLDSWNESAMPLARLAEERWLRLERDRDANEYVPVFPERDLPDPDWSDIVFEHLVGLAENGRDVRSEDDPIVRRLLRR